MYVQHAAFLCESESPLFLHIVLFSPLLFLFFFSSLSFYTFRCYASIYASSLLLLPGFLFLVMAFSLGYKGLLSVRERERDRRKKKKNKEIKRQIIEMTSYVIPSCQRFLSTAMAPASYLAYTQIRMLVYFLVVPTLNSDPFLVHCIVVYRSSFYQSNLQNPTTLASVMLWPSLEGWPGEKYVHCQYKVRTNYLMASQCHLVVICAKTVGEENLGPSSIFFTWHYIRCHYLGQEI